MSVKKNIRLANLFTLCEIISVSADREKIKQKIHSDSIDWLSIVEIANQEFLTPVLCYQLNKNDFFVTNNDEKLFTYLNEIFTINTNRNIQIVEQLKDIVSILNSSDIEPLLLKGSASLVENDYEHIGIRFLSDIDLMVSSKELEKAYRLLIKSGYKKIDANFIVLENHHHLWPLEKEGMPVMVELHRRVMGGNSGIEYIPFSTTTSLKSYNPYFSNTWVFNPTYKLYHAFFHTEVDDNNYMLKHLDLRHLYDFTVLTKKYLEEIDWDHLEQLVISRDIQNSFKVYLYMVKELFGLTTPLTVDNKRVRKDYNKVLKSFELQGTIRGDFYPLFPKLKKLYGNQKLKNTYHYHNDIYYIYYVLKHLIHQFKTYVFCNGCLKRIISKW